ncbi:MAG: ABC transporter substrate-binding protein [Rhodospirillales bacterium]|jgi:peptide/nickel transport system substrate-binding protein
MRKLKTFTNITVTAALVGAVSLLSSGTVQAQKSKDTVRFGLYQPIKILDRIYNPHPETNLTAPAVFDNLLFYDAGDRKYKPQLAVSWKRLDATTMEFILRKGVKFHDGSDFDAEDVAYMVKFVTDPKTKFRFKGTRFGWIAGTEIIDSHTIRIKSKGPYAPVLSRMATALPIYPSSVHGALKVKSTFGRNPIGTGPYKVTKVDPNQGIFFEKNENYYAGSKPAGMVKKLIARPIPDKQSQIAELMSGGLDIMYNVPKDQGENLAANPNLSISVTPTVSFVYVLFDAADRSGFGHFKNIKVRQAVLHAIDRKALVKALVPKQLHGQPLQRAICHDWHVGCKSSIPPLKHDLAKAKKLLAEAGLPNGFDVEITTWGPSRQIAEAVSGQLRKVGIKATVDALKIGGFVRKRAKGKVQMFVSLWDNGGAAPDVDTTAGFFFMKGSRNYMGDKELMAAHAAGRISFDLKKREAVYQAAFDRVTDQAYMMPLVPLPVVLAHTKEIVVHGGHKNPEGFELNRISWK